MCKAYSIDLGKVRRRSSTGRRMSRLLCDDGMCSPSFVGTEFQSDIEGLESKLFVFCAVDLVARYLFKLEDMLTVLENYRVMLVARVRILLEWILQACMHPASVCSLRDLQEWFIVWKCYFANLLSFNNKEKDEKLLDWVRSRVDKIEIENFSSSWRSGVLLCALVDSIVPGSCPRYDLLNEENRLGNAQLAVQLLEKLSIKSFLTAQELADDDADIEKPLKALLTQLRMTAAKRRLRHALKSPSDDASAPQNSEFFAKGMGLIFAVKGRKASFNIFRRGQRAFSFVIEIQGPDGTLGSALITHKSVRNQASNSKLKRQLSSESKKIAIDYSLTDEMISVFYTPVTSGKHTLNIVSQGQHILRSPYDVSVDCNTTEVTARVVETLFRPKKSALQKLGRRFSGTSLLASRLQETEVAVPFPNVEATGKVVARRVIKRTILNGDNNIVVPGDDERALVKALKDISNLNPENRERLRQERSFILRPVSELRNPHVNKLRFQMVRTVSEISERSSTDEGSPLQRESSLEMFTSSGARSEQDKNMLEANPPEATVESVTPLRNVPPKPRRLSLETVAEQVDHDNRVPPQPPIGGNPRTGDENNNPKFDLVHDHEFLIRKRNVTLNIVNENPYVPKTNHMLQTYRQSSHDALTEKSANDRRLLYQMEAKSQRFRSSWDFIPEKCHVDVENDSRKKRTFSREGHFGSGDEGDDRMSEIDGDVKALPVASVLEKFTRFSPTTSPECSTSGSSNGSEASGPRTTFGMVSGSSGNGFLHGY
ncbi:uncharacterized protein LOC100907901 [Galendromus occidentalis]|uniref:Uncharacterized protein LOC100907901 n=1 Tax=Galendromus occidentalis TaxID=34638 RepID=A0AAJ7WIH1_9ACAR|nr:uncharacterized protein LOC100907901 [Galendromus occidentalis]